MMKACPHAKGANGCNALLNNGFSRSTLVVPESWQKRFCSGTKYPDCPNLKAAAGMNQEREKRSSTGVYIERKEPVKKSNNSKDQQVKAKAAVHAHGGKKTHYCERPWRSSDLRFRVSVSDYYSRPWLT